MYFIRGVELSKEAVEKTRKYYYEIYKSCIDEVIEGKVKVNDMEKYIQDQANLMQEVMEGKHDNWLPFRQQAHFIQTGNSLALLP